MFVELHMLQNFAPSNLNRDDTNNPKDCEFGGVRRARISSQCLKRAMRWDPVFQRTTNVELGVRTKWLVKMLSERLAEAGKPKEELKDIVSLFVESTMSKLEAKSVKEDGYPRTAVLLYFGQQELADMMQALSEAWDRLQDKEARKATIEEIAKAIVKSHKGWTTIPDIALFGRMLAEKPELGLEAACQVAHAISTHRVAMEMDFYTAVDDLNPEDTAGAGMMGFTGYDSACFYRYARLDWEQLLTNLKGDAGLARRTVEGFLRATVAAVPGAKQNSFAALNPPSLLLAIVRQDGMAWSLVNAFERPVRTDREGGFLAPSAAALDAYWGRLCQVYGTQDHACVVALALDGDLPLQNLKSAQVTDLENWIGAVLKALPKEAKA